MVETRKIDQLALLTMLRTFACEGGCSRVSLLHEYDFCSIIIVKIMYQALAINDNTLLRFILLESMKSCLQITLLYLRDFYLRSRIHVRT